MVLTQENYYSAEADKAYMSNSQYKKFKACPAAALAELRGEYVWQYADTTKEAFLAGQYVDAALTGDLELFKAQNPDLIAQTGKNKGGLKEPYKKADCMIARIKVQPLFMLLMSGDRQMIMTGEIAGVPFKGKADVILDESAVDRIRREFPENADLFEFTDGAIVDLKTTKDFSDVWDADERRRVSWIEARRYDIQGAIYQRLAGGHLPFILAAVSKEAEPDLRAIHIPDSVLSDASREVEENAPRFQRIKLGLEPPTRCEKCAYCRATRKMTRIEEYGEDMEETT